MRRQRTGSREYLQRRRMPPGIPRPVRLGRRTERRGECRLRLAPARSGMHVTYGGSTTSHHAIGAGRCEARDCGAAVERGRCGGRRGAPVARALEDPGRAGAADLCADSRGVGAAPGPAPGAGPAGVSPRCGDGAGVSAGGGYRGGCCTIVAAPPPAIWSGPGSPNGSRCS